MLAICDDAKHAYPNGNSRELQTATDEIERQQRMKGKRDNHHNHQARRERVTAVSKPPRPAV